jgi:hypothetical protein
MLHKKIELDHIVGTGKKVNLKKRVQGLNSDPQNRFFRVSFSIKLAASATSVGVEPKTLNSEPRTRNPNSDHQVFSIPNPKSKIPNRRTRNPL